MPIQSRFLPIMVLFVAFGVVGWAALDAWATRNSNGRSAGVLERKLGHNLDVSVARINRLFEERWSDEHIEPSGAAEPLQVLRRLTLALVGTVPSLAEIREFEADSAPDRLRRWTVRLMADRRFAEYFAERLAVAFVGTFQQDVPWFTHARFEAWLADQLATGQPYDEIVRRMISESGRPTSNGAVNFVTAELVQGEQYANRLAARTARAFLGQRIDCAECHDHPFDVWKQTDFQGLASYFAQVRTRSGGVEEDRDRKLEVEDRQTLEKRVIEPRVPFHAEWLSEHDSRRHQLAAWITHWENLRFGRAISNRVWGLLFGRPYLSPVDAIPDPQEVNDVEPPDEVERANTTELLDVLAADLREHGGDLRRLILVIASSRPFQMASVRTHTESVSDAERCADTWATYPLVQLRPEQFARSLEQAASLRTMAADEDLLTLIRREQWMQKFIEHYGTLNENELDDRTDSIPQTVQRMHSQFTHRKCRAEWTNAVGRIALMAPDDAACLETCYLVCLTRRPTEAERQLFLTQLQDAGTRRRSRVVEDIFWTLFNSPEFSWNH